MKKRTAEWKRTTKEKRFRWSKLKFDFGYWCYDEDGKFWQWEDEEEED